MAAAILVTLLVGLMGCGKCEEGIAPELRPYVDRFNEIAGREVVVSSGTCAVLADANVLVGFGVCKDDGLIVVNRLLWDSYNEEDREILFFHELGHCALGRSHDNRVDKYGAPMSMMHWAGVPMKRYMAHRQYYLDELFGRAH